MDMETFGGLRKIVRRIANRRSFDFASHDKAVRGFAQDDNSFAGESIVSTSSLDKCVSDLAQDDNSFVGESIVSTSSLDKCASDLAQDDNSFAGESIVSTSSPTIRL